MTYKQPNLENIEEQLNSLSKIKLKYEALHIV